MRGCFNVVMVCIAAFIGLIIFGTMINEPRSASGPSSTRANITQRGYFKDKKGNRLYTLEIGPGIDAADVQAHAMQLTHRGGQVMSAYYYPAGSRMPVDGVTLARDYFSASAALDTPGLSPFAYVFIRNFNGSTSFVDCRATPSQALCMRSTSP